MSYGSGPASLTGGGNIYTLDFGTLALSALSLQVTLSLTNDVPAPADTLAGSFTSAPGTFQLTNFATFAGLLAGQSVNGLTVDFTPDTLGNYTGSITLAPRSQNTSGFDGALGPVTVNLNASVVPEPGSAVLLAIGSMLAGLRRRRPSRRTQNSV